MNNKTNVIYFLLLIFLLTETSLWGQIGSHRFPKPVKKTQFSDEVLIKSAIYRFKQSVKNQDHKLFERLISKNFDGSTGVVRGKLAAKQKFIDMVKNQDMSLRSKYSRRRTPKLKNIKPTWDFEIDITDIKIFRKQGKAIVKCNIYFAMDQPDDVPGVHYGKGPKKVKETIILVKRNNKWKIERMNRFFHFLSDRKNRLTKWKQ